MTKKPTPKKTNNVPKAQKNDKNQVTFSKEVLFYDFFERLASIPREAGTLYHKSAVRMCLATSLETFDNVKAEVKDAVLKKFDEMTGRLVLDERDDEDNPLPKKMLNKEEIDAIMISLTR